MRSLALVPLLTWLAAAATAQPAIQQVDSLHQVDTTHLDSTHRDTTPLTPGQEKYIDGLKTAGRGVAQLKDGINQVARATGVRDTTKIRQAGHRLRGLCGAAHGFLINGRAGMNANSFVEDRHKPARDLAVRVDSLAVRSRACEQTATKQPGNTSDDLLTHIRAYEEALAAFRTSIGLPNKTPTPPAAIPPRKP